MADVFLGLFRTLFEVVASRLVAQLYTGSSLFGFNKVNTDSTAYTGLNNIYMAKESESLNKKRLARSVSWIESTTERAVIAYYPYGKMNIDPTPSPSTAIEPEEGEIFITVNGVFVAKAGEGRRSGFPSAPIDNAYPWGGFHIKDVSGTDYVVGYQLVPSTNGFTINRYQSILNMSIDQTTIALMTYDSQVVYVEDSDFSCLEVLYYDTPESNTYEWTRYLPRASRILTVNASGDKTIFFCARRSAGTVAWADAEYRVVFELTDDGTDFEVNEILEYENIDETGIANGDVHSVSGLYTTSSIATCTCNPYLVTQRNTTHSVTYSDTHTLTGYDKFKTFFLGCSYDRFTDDPIIAIHANGSKAFLKTSTSDYTGGGTVDNLNLTNSLSGTWTYTSTSNAGAYGTTVDNRENKIIIRTIGGSDEVVCSSGNSSVVETYTGSRTHTDWDEWTSANTGTQVTKKIIIEDYHIVDLAHKMVAYLAEEHKASLTYSYTSYITGGIITMPGTGGITWDMTSPNVTTIYAEKKSVYYLYAAGDEHLLWDDPSPSADPSISPGFSLYAYGDTSSSCTGNGCIGAPVLSCGDPPLTSITTSYVTTYTTP